MARLRRRSYNATSGKVRHDTAYQAWELSIRLALVASGVHDPIALRTATIGQLVGALNLPRHRITEPPLLDLLHWLTRHGMDRDHRRTAATRQELLDAVPAYRNRIIGHGTVQSDAFYQAGAPVLLAALDSAWESGLLVDTTATLTHVESIAIDSDGQRIGRILNLGSENPIVESPLGTPVPESLRPRRLYFRTHRDWIPLHPWVVFDGQAEGLYCFNGFRRRPEYLDHASGRSLRTEELRELFPGLIEELESLFNASSAPTEPSETGDAARLGDFTRGPEIGRGGTGTVYLAVQDSLDRQVALKLLNPQALGDATTRRRFQQEIDALARCEHPNVVKVLASGVSDQGPYYAMEYIDGVDLKSLIPTLRGSPDLASAIHAAGSETDENAAAAASSETIKQGTVPRDVVTLLAGAADGLHHLHENGIVHRDVSPANIMVTRSRHAAVIMDLGLASLEGGTVQLTQQASGVLGTLRYVAPELLQRSVLAVDRRADIYGLGATLHEALSGRPMFDGDSEARLLEQVLHEDPTPLDRVVPGVSRDLATVVHQSIQKDPRLRYQTALEMKNDLEACLEGRPIAANPPTLRYLLTRWAVRNPVAAALTVGLVLVLMLSGFAIAGLEHRRAAEIQLRHDSHAAVNLLARTDELHPIHPDTIPAMSRWLATARDIVARGPRHRRSLTRMRESANEVVEARREDFEISNLRSRRAGFARILERFRSQQEAGEGDPSELARSIEIIEPELTRIDALLEEIDESAVRISWHLPSREQQLQHDSLARLVEAVDRLDGDSGAIAEIQGRIEQARALQRESIEAASDRWSRAAASIASVDDCPMYDGLHLPPQLGLIPLGRDPRSRLWEFWHVLSGEEPARDASGRHVLKPESGMILVLIPGGTLRMGAQSTDADQPGYDPEAGPSESPVHEVELAPFFLSKYEVTISQWERMDGTRPNERFVGSSVFGNPRISVTHPVEHVSWEECRRALSRWSLVLPTEAQWEWAARAGTTTPRPWDGQDDSSILTWANSDAGLDGDLSTSDGYRLHAEVGSFPPNAFGLHDTIGNVAEWCVDWHASSYERVREVRPGDGEHVPTLATLRSFRGMSFKHAPRDLRVTTRHGRGSNERDEYLGVRASRPVSFGSIAVLD